MFAPNLVSYFLVTNTLREASGNPLVRRLVENGTLVVCEWGLHIFMGFIGTLFFCRLLQICDPKFFDISQIEEQDN